MYRSLWILLKAGLAIVLFAGYLFAFAWGLGWLLSMMRVSP